MYKSVVFNINDKGLARKLEDENFLQIVREYDVLCLSECWVKCPNDFNLKGYEKKYLFRNKCNGGGVVIFSVIGSGTLGFITLR
jgi:hypothetical protein